MTYSGLHKLFKEYTTEKEFQILGVDIFNTDYQGRDAYVYVHNKISYFTLETYHQPLTDDIQKELYKEVKKLIRKKKINDILKEDFNI